MPKLLKNKLIKFLKSEYYHNEIKDCKIIPKHISVKRGRAIKGNYCQTHQKDICRCG